MLELFFVIYSLTFAKLTCYLALTKNRNKDLWYLAGFIGGFIPAFILLYLPEIEDENEERIFLTRFEKNV